MEQENEHARVDIKAVLKSAERAFLAPPPPERVAEVCASLLARSGAERAGSFAALKPAERLATVRRLIADAFGLREENLPRALAMTQAATKLAPLLGLGKGHGPFAKDLEAEAWAQHANLLRIAGDLSSAEADWAQVESALAKGSGDAALCADLLEMKATLRRDQRRFLEADEHLREAAWGCEALLDDRHLASRARISLATTYRVDGRAKDAFRLLQRAAAGTDPKRHPEQVLGLLHNQALVLADLGRKAQALSVMKAAWPLYLKLARPVFLLRASWTRGRLHALLHDYPHAVRYLEDARQGFVERQMSYDAALAALDLAQVYARCQERRKVRELALGMVPVFVSEGIEREASAALLLFVESARWHIATPESIAQTREQLETLQRRGRGETAG